MATAATTEVVNEVFLRNMRALWRIDPVLAMRVDAVNDDERLVLKETRSGHSTARAHTADGQSVYLHSRYEPVDEALKLVEAVPKEKKFCFVVSGLGLGYHVRALGESLTGDAVLLCCEPSIETMATALSCVDLAQWIESRQLIFILDDDKAVLHQKLQSIGSLLMLGMQFVKHGPSMRVAHAAHEKMIAALTEFVSFMGMTLATLVSNAFITCKNIAMNLPAYVSTPPIDVLRNRFAGNPAVVISAGPSLRRNIDQLAALKGRAVLCAVQTTLKPLMERGIVPDFVTSLDFHAMSQKYFEGIGDLSQVHLVAEPKATWHVVDDYPGPLSLLDNAWARLVIGDKLAARDGLQAGATVAHLAFYLAVYMGCDPIIFVGQDLAFSRHVFYVPGVEIHRAWRSEVNRFNTMEQKEWDRIVRNRPILRKVAAASEDSGELYTDDLLFTYLEQFEKDIAHVQARVINATEGGARIRGTKAMTLQNAVDQYCDEPIDPQRFAYRSELTWRDDSKLAATLLELDRRQTELKEVITVCDELLDILTKLEKLTDQPSQFNRLLVRVDELRTKIGQDTRGFCIVSGATQLAEFQRFSADRQLSASTPDDDGDRALKQIKRDREFVTSFRAGAKDVLPVLSDAHERVAKVMS